jgi:hypothetical protein
MKIMLKNVRLCFARNLFQKSKPTAAGADAKEKYQGEFILEVGSPNHALMKEAINGAAKVEWGDKAEDTLKAVAAAACIWALRDGDLKDRPEYKGKLVASAKNEIRPLVIDEARSPMDADDSRIYSGCYVNAIIDVKAGSKPKKQVYAYLLGVQKVADGERLSGSVAAADDFEEIPQAEGHKAAAGGGAASLF